MTPPNDSLSDMLNEIAGHDLPDSLFDAGAHVDHNVLEILTSLKEVFTAGPAPHIGETLAGFLGPATAAATAAAGVAATAAGATTTAATATTSSAITAAALHTPWIASTTAKILIGTSAAAASLGTAHVTGAIDIPLLPAVESHTNLQIQDIPADPANTTIEFAPVTKLEVIPDPQDPSTDTTDIDQKLDDETVTSQEPESDSLPQDPVPDNASEPDTPNEATEPPEQPDSDDTTNEPDPIENIEPAEQTEAPENAEDTEAREQSEAPESAEDTEASDDLRRPDETDPDEAAEN